MTIIFFILAVLFALGIFFSVKASNEIENTLRNQLENAEEKLEAFRTTYSELDNKYSELEKKYKEATEIKPDEEIVEETKPVKRTRKTTTKKEVKEEPKKRTRKTTTKKESK